MARAQIALMQDHAELIAEADFGPPGSKARSAPNQFLRTHIGILIQEADPDADWEMLADLLLAPLAAESFLYWCRVREQTPERLLAAFDLVVDRLLPTRR
jgi:hypothetical protein